MARNAVRNALKQARRLNQANPWDPEAVERRRVARVALARVLRDRGELGRAAEVEGCGHARVAFSSSYPGLGACSFFRWSADDEAEHRAAVDGGAIFGTPPTPGPRSRSGLPVCVEVRRWLRGAEVVDRHGLAAALVSECGCRLCPTCAGRASSRNKRRILDRMEAMGAVTAKAEAGARFVVEAVRTSPLVPDLDTAPAPLVKFRRVAGTLTRSSVDPLASTVFSSRWDAANAGTLDEKSHDAGLLGLSSSSTMAARGGLAFLQSQYGAEVKVGGSSAFTCADDLLTAWRAEVSRVERENWRRSSTTFCGIAVEPLPPLPLPERPTVETRGGRVVDAAGRILGGTVAVVAARRGLAKAEKALHLALSREWAAHLLARVESRSWAPMLRAVEARAVDDAAAVVEAVEPSGPSCWHGRDRLRYRSLCARLDIGDTRAARTLARLDAEARARFVGQQARWCAARARDSWEAARALFRQRADLYKEARAAAAKAKLWRDRDVKFFTLTQPARSGETCADAMSRLAKGLSRLQRTAAWRSTVAGGVVRIEVERSTPATRAAAAAAKRRHASTLRGAAVEAAERGDDALAASLSSSSEAIDLDASRLHRQHGSSKGRRSQGSWWHAHAHLALSSGYVDQAAWHRAWSKALDIPLPRGAVRVEPAGGNVVNEITKYVTKPVGLGALTHVEVGELVTALRGARVLRCVGALYGVVVEADEATTTADSEGVAAAMADETGSTPLGVVAGTDLVVYPADVLWRTDAAAQEVRHRRLGAAWAAAQARRVRADVEVPSS